MLHPDIVFRKSQINGNGLFAKRDITKGTILWRMKNVRVYSIPEFSKFSKRYRDILTKFAYQDPDNRKFVYCTDKAKYWNHSCSPNSAPLVSEDIAIRDIKKGEEVTYDYGILLVSWAKPLKCKCGSKACRGIIRRLPANSKAIGGLKAKARAAAKFISKIRQPLLERGEIAQRSLQ